MSVVIVCALTLLGRNKGIGGFIMARRKEWTFSEEKVLMEHYQTKTIKELMVMLPSRGRESINNKIKRLKAAGKIDEGKTDKAKARAYHQRGKDVFFTVDQA